MQNVVCTLPEIAHEHTNNLFFLRSAWNVNNNTAVSTYGTTIQGQRRWTESPTQTTSLRCCTAHNDGIHISGGGGKLPLDHFQLTSSNKDH